MNAVTVTFSERSRSRSLTARPRSPLTWKVSATSSRSRGPALTKRVPSGAEVDGAVVATVVATGAADELAVADGRAEVEEDVEQAAAAASAPARNVRRGSSGTQSAVATPTGQLTPVPPSPQ